MGKILKQRRTLNGVLAEIQLSTEEALDLGGVMDNVTVFTEDRARIETHISLRGKKEATKYFLIPRVLRKKLNLFGSVSCQRLQHGDKDIFVYVVGPDSQRKNFVSEAE